MPPLPPSRHWLLRSLLFGLPLLAMTLFLRREHAVDRALLAGRDIEDMHMERLWEYTPTQLDRAFRRARGLNESDQAILRAAAIHRLEPRILIAVAMRESRMNPNARGAAGEIGMFQIMPITAKHWAQITLNPTPSEEELFDVSLNAEISAWYLRRGLDTFAHRDDPLPFALAYYNAGPSRAQTWAQSTPEGEDFLDHIPFPTTRDYVRGVTRSVRQGR